MAEISATDAKNRFGQLLEIARTEPVRIQKNGRDVGVMVSPDHYAELLARAELPRVRPAVEQRLERSIAKRKSLYEALAK